jgi:hypothetical protein
VLIMEAILTIPYPFIFGACENPKPGKLGTIT